MRLYFVARPRLDDFTRSRMIVKRLLLLSLVAALLGLLTLAAEDFIIILLHCLTFIIALLFSFDRGLEIWLLASITLTSRYSIIFQVA